MLTVDSKGFAFRVLRALQADRRTRDTVTRMHYVAPSVWAYAHRQQRNVAALAQLLHRMFVLLPFEEGLFVGHNNSSNSRAEWCQFVGHPAVEDFLEFHGQFDTNDTDLDATIHSCGPDAPEQLRVAPEALLDVTKYDPTQLASQGAVFQSLMAAKSTDATATQRKALGIPTDAFVICALVGR